LVSPKEKPWALPEQRGLDERAAAAAAAAAAVNDACD
jgi:hypothetical protein